MVSWKTHVLVHVESDDMFEGDLASLVTLDKDFVNRLWTATSRETKDEGVCRCRIEIIDPGCILVSLLGSHKGYTG